MTRLEKAIKRIDGVKDAVTMCLINTLTIRDILIEKGLTDAKDFQQRFKANSDRLTQNSKKPTTGPKQR